MTTPINDVLDRLKLNLDDLVTAQVLKSCARMPEVFPLEREAFPYAYVIPGALVGARPSDAGGAGGVALTRQFNIRCLCQPLADAEDKEDGLGADVLVAVIGVIESFIEYFLIHPRLDTVAAPQGLNWVQRDVTFTDSGPRRFAAPGGADYAGFDFVLTVERLQKAKRLS